MNDRKIYLILGLILFTILFGIGITNIDSLFSSISSDAVAIKSVLISEGKGQTLLLGTNYLFHYHLGLVFLIVGYVASIGMLLWYFQKEEKMSEERRWSRW